MENVQKIKNFIKFYNNEEIKSMNFIFGKDSSNNWFTQEELAFASAIDLHNQERLEAEKFNWINSNLE